MEEDALEALAVEEILKDLKRGAERAKEHGALGWQKNPVPPTNKRFLRNMLVSTLRDDRPLTFKRKFQDGGRPQRFEDNNPRRNSDGYFRYNDKYSPKNRPDSEGRDIQESYAETYSQSQNNRHESDNGEAGVSFSESRHRSGYSNKRPREPSPDSPEERKNGDIKDSKKKRKKHHKKTNKKDGDETVKKKHKKSKKAKKHKSKKSSHSTKDKS